MFLILLVFYCYFIAILYLTNIPDFIDILYAFYFDDFYLEFIRIIYAFYFDHFMLNFMHM
jgi:hypothetical protein